MVPAWVHSRSGENDNMKMSAYSESFENYAKRTGISYISLVRERDKIISMPKSMLTFSKSKMFCVFCYRTKSTLDRRG